MKPEKFFTAIILFAGILLLLITPLGAGFDEETQMGRIWEMAHGVFIPNQYLGKAMNFPYAFFQLSYRQDVNMNPVTWEDWLEQSSVKIDPQLMRVATTRAIYFPSLYSVQAVIMGFFGRLLDTPVMIYYYLIRLSYLLMYAALVYLSIRIIPVGKWVLGILAVLPMSLIQSAIVSPDGVNNGVCFLFFAWILYLNGSEKRNHFSKRDYFITLLLVLAICTLKMNCIPMLLLLFLIPSVKFGTKRYCILFILFVIASFVVVFLGWNYLTSSQLSAISSESSLLVDNLKLIFADPLQVFSLIFGNIASGFGKYYREWVGVSGYDYWYMPGFVYWLTPLLLLVAVLAESAGEFLTQKMRVFLAACFLCIFFGTFGIFFLIYHAPGGGIIGVQGRYFIIAIPLLLVALLPRRNLLKIHPVWFQGTALAIGLVCVSALALAYHVPCGESYYTPGACFLPKYKNWSPSTSLSLELSESTSVTQLFQAECNSLNQVRFWISARGQRGFTFQLENEDTDQIEYSAVISPDDLPEAGWYTVHIPEILDSNKQTYQIIFSPSEGEQGESVHLAYFDRNEYLRGDLNLNGQWIENDLLFQYGCSTGLDRLLNHQTNQ